MINKATVLILGAGASCPYGFPTGLQLKAHICKALLGLDTSTYDVNREMTFVNDMELYWALKNLPLETDPDHINYLKHEPDKVDSEIKKFVRGFAEDLMLSPDASIDAFLEHHPDYEDIGHRAIASVLLPYETQASLFDSWLDKWTDSTNKEQHWYQYFFPRLNSTLENFGNNDIAVVTFNYDRSFEYFLLRAIRAKYKGIDWQEAKQKLRTIPIIHLYGKLGSLTPSEVDSDPPVGYGGVEKIPSTGTFLLSREKIDQAASCIKTINDEYAPDQPEFVKARQLISKAERVYFLGFGYLEENMKRLFTEKGKDNYNLLKDQRNVQYVKDYKFYGTTYGLSIHDRNKLSRIGLFNKNIHSDISSPFPDATIYDFLHNCEYSSLD